MAYHRSHDKIDLGPKTSSDGSRGPRRPRTTTFADAEDEGPRRLDDLLATGLGGLIPVSGIMQLDSTTPDDFRRAMTAVIKDGDRVARKLHKQRKRGRKHIRRSYADSWLGGLRGGIALAEQDRVYHAALQESRSRHLVLIAAIEQASGAVIAETVAAKAEQAHRQLTDPFEQADYLRERSRIEHAARFDVEIGQADMALTQKHELAVFVLRADLQRDLVTIDAEIRAAERGDLALEADKNRAYETDRDVLDLGEKFFAVMVELDQVHRARPTEQVTAAMDLMSHAMQAYSEFYSSLSDKEKEENGPGTKKVMLHAMEQALRAARG